MILWKGQWCYEPKAQLMYFCSGVVMSFAKEPAAMPMLSSFMTAKSFLPSLRSSRCRKNEYARKNKKESVMPLPTSGASPV